MTDGHGRDGNYGTVFLKGHILRGQLALDSGDIKAASEHLLTAADIRGGTTLDSYGTSMVLAKALLKKGRKDVVIAYLRRCKEFWPSEKKKLPEWIAEIHKGGTPKFGHNPEYQGCITLRQHQGVLTTPRQLSLR